MIFSEEIEFVCITYWDESLYRQALDWAQGNRRAVFISELERISENSRVKIFSLESPLQILPLAKKIGWSAVFKTMVVVGEGELKEAIEKYHLVARLILSEAADWGVGALNNARANDLPFRRGMELKGAFAQIPALIVGAGPSLRKNGHLIREFEKRALIFAAGTALNVLDVEPHFGASIDAQAPYRQFKMYPFSQTPFCYQSRMNPDNLSLLQGERILFPDSSSAAINWIYGEEMFDGGWTVGNFATAVALHLGCSPIIFVGMDLCYADGEKYAGLKTQTPEGLVQVDGVWTQSDWLMAARWTEEKKGPFINATEGGLLRLPKEPLESVLKQCTREWDLRKQIHETLLRLPLCQLTRWDEWDESLRHLQKDLAHLEENVVYQKLLSPLWQIWKPIFEREVEVDPQQKIEYHQRLFFQQVIEEHGAAILSER